MITFDIYLKLEEILKFIDDEILEYQKEETEINENYKEIACLKLFKLTFEAKVKES